MWKHANKNKHKNKTQFSENFLREIALSEHKNSVSEHQNFKIFSDSMLPDPPWWLAPSALTWFLGYLKIHPDCTYSQVGLSDYSKLKMKNLQGDFQFLIHLIICCQCLRPTPKNPHPKAKPLALWVFRKAKKKYWTNVKTTPNMDRVMGTWFGLLNNRHMIKNKELEFKHRWYILQQTREDTLAFLYLYRKVRREVDILQSWGRHFELILGQIVSMREKLYGNTNLVASCYIEKKHDSFPVDVRRLKTFLLNITTKEIDLHINFDIQVVLNIRA